MAEVSDLERPLAEFKAQREFFVGIDSDGCAFDTMEIKHKECFIPNFVKSFDLQPVSKYAREAHEFVNLYSKWRGINRWPAMIRSLDLTRERAEVVQRGAKIPMLPEVRKFIDSGLALSNEGLKKYIAKNDHPELGNALDWSEAVNASVELIVHNVPPYPFVRESLAKIQAVADIIVVSATPGDALRREWTEHGIAPFAHLIAGQEMGTKERHLTLAAKGKYPAEKILMIGDAPGDFKAARSIGALFYPVNPGREDASWQRFYNEAFDVFKSGRYAGDYEKKLIAEFEALLPDTPPWKR